MTASSPVADPPATFTADWESLETFSCPDWFRDAKFGIWAHWGPQCVPMIGDWYARNMYIDGEEAYAHHIEHYGHPSEFGYKDIVQLWKAERFDPADLMHRYKRAGAKYFTSCAVHHDNFDCWDSTHHPWSSVNIGPKRDIVGAWAEAARAEGLRFGVTEHLERSYSWFNTNKMSDKAGPKAGVPYDGNDPEYQDFYFPPHSDRNRQYPLDPPDWWMQNWRDRMIDLIDRYEPDLLYTDGAVPFGEIGRSVVAHLYNRSIERTSGTLDAVYNLKSYHASGKHNFEESISEFTPLGGHGEFRPGIGILDLERGGLSDILDQPWQTDTCIGNWYYRKGMTYKSAQLVIHMLADIVSKNGNLLLNFPMLPDGSLDSEAIAVLDGLTDWFAVNGEAIYGTRPWTRYGQGRDFPTGDFAEPNESPLGAGDYRFVTKGPSTLFAIAMGWPDDGAFVIERLGKQRVQRVEMLGHHGPLGFTPRGDGIRVTAPAKRPCDLAYSLKITLG
ncbi:MAG: alpha-L-fucosidase [Planctomycetota bacterium]